MMSITEILKDEAVRAYLHRLIGKDGLNLLEKFPEQGSTAMRSSPEETGINLNSVRHTLYTLYEKGLQSPGGSRTRRPGGSPTSGRCASTGARLPSPRT